MDNLMNTFVPRVEIEGRLKNIEKVVERIDKKIDR